MLKLLFFYADVEGPSRLQEELVKNIEILFKGKVEVRRINIEKDRENVEKYGVTEVPTIIIEKNGRIRDKFVGLAQELFLKRALERSL
ncbi:MAG: hypothetical protein ISS48_02115 [Candidatus Aenigmarchaeota archaeon]|nr:hypothetical protein [Candidatus Aenigmarchaeota archaeon]